MLHVNTGSDRGVPSVGHAGCVGPGRRGAADPAGPCQWLRGLPAAEASEEEPAVERQAPQDHERDRCWNQGKNFLVCVQQ